PRVVSPGVPRQVNPVGRGRSRAPAAYSPRGWAGPAGRRVSARWPDRCGERIIRTARLGRWRAPGRDRRLPAYLLADGHDDGLIRGRAVLAVESAQHAFPAGLAEQLVEQPVVDPLALRELVMGGLGDRRHRGMGG